MNFSQLISEKFRLKYLLAQWKKYPLLPYVLGISFIVLCTIMYALLMLNRYWQFEYFFVDNVYFHTAFWKLARFEEPMVYHPVYKHINIFNDHFHPIILVIAFFLMIFPANETVFVIMAVTYGLAGLFGMLLGFSLLKNKLVTLAMLVPFFFFIGSQNAMLFGFHEINFMPLFFLAAVWAWWQRKWAWFWVAYALLLLTKESMVTIAVTLAFWMLLARLKEWKPAVMAMIIPFVYYFAVIKFVMPSFSGMPFFYSGVDTPSSLPELIDKLTNPPEKIETFLVSVASFGGLPLLNPFTLPLLLQDFVVRYTMAIPGNVQYTLTYHYGLVTAPILFASTMFSLAFWQKRLPARWWNAIEVGVIILVAFSSIYYLNFYRLKGPLRMVLNKDFYQTTKQNAFLWELIRQTPEDGKVMTQNHLGLPLSHLDVWPLPQTPKELSERQPKYIVYDTRKGQNPNNYFPTTEATFLELIKEVTQNQTYKVRYQQGDMIILERSAQ